MDLEFEPLPEAPPPGAPSAQAQKPPSPTPSSQTRAFALRAARGAARGALRGAELARRARAGWRTPTLSRSVATSVLLHAGFAVLLWLLVTLPEPAERDEPKGEVTFQVWPPPVSDTDPEAEPGGGLGAKEPPKGVEKGGARTVPGQLLDDDDTSAAARIGVGATFPGSAYAGRIDGKEGLLAAGGGNGATEGALRVALAWLARHQAADGTWSAATFQAQCRGDRCEGAGESGYVEATTGLALLPYLGAGHTHRDGPWADTVKRGLRALARRQHDDGSFGSDAKRGYASAIGALALAEAYGLTQSPSLLGPAQRAADFLVRTQSRGGGWRYHPGDGETDSSVTGWAVIALCSARKSGLSVPPETFNAARAWFGNVRGDDGQFGYLSRGGGSAALLGVGAFAEVMLGADPASPRLDATFALLERRLPRPARGESDAAEEYGVADPIHWTYGALAAFQRGGGTWRVWNERLRDALLTTQIRDESDARGSWPAMGATGRHGGRVVTTALCALALEVYYRYPRATLR